MNDFGSSEIFYSTKIFTRQTLWMEKDLGKDFFHIYPIKGYFESKTFSQFLEQKRESSRSMLNISAHKQRTDLPNTANERYNSRLSGEKRYFEYLDWSSIV